MPRRKRLDTTPEWKALKAHAAQMKAVSLQELFAADPERAGGRSVWRRGAGIWTTRRTG